MNVRGFDCFFFDWDGCLAATLPLWMELYQKALQRRGIVAAEAQVVRELFNDWTGPARFGIRDPGEFAAEIKQGLRERVGEVRLNPEVPEVLRSLRAAGCRVAVLTGSLRGVVEPVLERADLAGSVDLLLALEDVRRHKPDPEVVQKALARLRAAPEQALMVGDSPIDVRTGRNAGVDTVLFYPPANRRFYDPVVMRAAGAGRMISDLRELLELAEPREGQSR